MTQPFRSEPLPPTLIVHLRVCTFGTRDDMYLADKTGVILYTGVTTTCLHPFHAVLVNALRSLAAGVLVLLYCKDALHVCCLRWFNEESSHSSVIHGHIDECKILDWCFNSDLDTAELCDRMITLEMIQFCILIFIQECGRYCTGDKCTLGDKYPSAKKGNRHREQDEIYRHPPA